MKQSVCRYIFILLLFPVLISRAQKQQLKFIPVTGTNGISLGKINSIVKDKYGFIWLSDQSNRCIIKYDGTHMMRYQNDPKNPNSLGGFYPETLFADSNGNIWIGFYGMGLDKFDPVRNIFTHYRHKDNEPGTLGHDFVTALLMDHLGNLWVGTYGGLDLLDEKTGSFTHFKNKPNDSSSLSCDSVRALYEDRSGTLWIGTGFAFDPSNDNGGLNRFNRSSGTFTRYLHDPKNPNSLINNKVRAILEDSYGNFWVGTAGDGLHTMDRKTGMFTRFTRNAAKPELLSRTALLDVYDHITFIIEDAERKIWIGTLINGIIRYDPLTKKIDHFGSREDVSRNLKDSTSWCATPTPDGMVWLSTQRANFFKVDLFNTVIPYYTSKGSHAFTSFNEEDDSVVLFGTDGGLIRKNLNNGTERRFLHDQHNPASLSSDTVTNIIKDRQGDFWISTTNGLNHYQVKTGKFTTIYDSTNAFGKAALKICLDNDSNLWAANLTSDQLGGGLSRLNLRTGKFTNYKNEPSDPYSLSSNSVSSFIVDEATGLWIGTLNNGGLDRMNTKSGKFMHYLPGLYVSSMFKDRSGVIWVGTMAGLFQYNRQTDRFNSISDNNSGINIVAISSIEEDKADNLWISTETGIYMLNKKRDQVVRYGKENGIPDANADFIYGSSFTGKNGEIYFGDIGGYYAFNPANLNHYGTETPLYLTRFWLDNTEQIAGNNGPLQSSLYDTKEIKLNHDQNVFSFSATFVDFRNTGDRLIYYQLENYDQGWRTATSEERIQYYKIPPGHYILKLKTANAGNGDWIEKSMPIIISPPWWNTWWAWCIYGLLFIAAAFYLHRYQKQQVINAEREKTRVKELAQAKEMEKAYNELRTTQSQLIHAEKMASLGELTAGIAHEIQNPLNFVNNFSEVNKELVEELELERGKENPDLNREQELLNDIKSNEEKISFHGRRADAIVKSMLQHSQSSSGKKEPADINALADEYLRLSYHGLRAKDKSFNSAMQTNYDASIGQVNIIQQDIGRVMLNIYNNAFYAVNEKKKLFPQGYEPTVSVSTKRLNGKLEIMVKDNGNGIPQKVREKIFQPFFTTKPAGQGTGLGLSLSYDIVKAQGGDIKLETKEGEYTTFIIQLPA
jgi:ligand-binding sensor domain-containing protein/signal transduction histidine kinase